MRGLLDAIRSDAESRARATALDLVGDLTDVIASTSVHDVAGVANALERVALRSSALALFRAAALGARELALLLPPEPKPRMVTIGFNYVDPIAMSDRSLRRELERLRREMTESMSGGES